MAWEAIPTPDRKDHDGITVDDAPIVIDDIEIVDEPRVIHEADDLIFVPSPTVPGPTRAELDAEEAAGIQALFGPEMAAGISVVILFVIFAIVLTGGAPEQPRENEETPVSQIADEAPPEVAPEVIEVEIGEPLVLERGE